MNQEEKIDKLLELQIKQTTDTALIRKELELHLEDYKVTKKSHYELRDEFKGVKAKVVVFSALIGSIITLIGNWIKNTFYN